MRAHRQMPKRQRVPPVVARGAPCFFQQLGRKRDSGVRDARPPCDNLRGKRHNAAGGTPHEVWGLSYARVTPNRMRLDASPTAR